VDEVHVKDGDGHLVQFVYGVDKKNPDKQVVPLVAEIHVANPGAQA